MYYNEEHKQRVISRGDNYTYIGSYKLNETTIDKKKSKMHIRVKCPYCGKKYDVRFDTFSKKAKCKYCCNKYKDSFAYHIEEELGLDLNDYWDWEENGRRDINPWDITKQSHETIYIWCQNKWYHGSYKTKPSLFYSGNRCPYCFNRKVHPKDSFAQWGIDNIDENFLEKYWSKKNDELNINPWKIAPQSNKKIYMLCQEKDYHNDEGGYLLMPNDFYNGKRCGYCGNRKLHPKDSFGYLYQEKAKYWSPNNDKSPFEVAPKTDDKYKFICEKCGEEFERGLSNMNRWDTGVVCKKCNSSQGETRIIRWLNQNNIDYIYDKSYFDDLASNLGYSLRPDFILPDRKIWIEYDGEFHYKDFYHDGSFERLQEHDKRKNKYAKEHNWKLIRIPYWEFDNIENILTKQLNL